MEVEAPNSADNSSQEEQSSNGQAQQALDFTDNSATSETSSDRGTIGTKDESTSQEVTSSNTETEEEDEDGPRRMS